jgi:hypothetical protein
MHDFSRDWDVVYFVQARTLGLIKIGYSKGNPWIRVNTIRTCSPDIIDPIGIERGGRRREIHLHARFTHIRVRGEWFLPDPELLDYIKDNAVGFPADPWDSPSRKSEKESRNLDHIWGRP